MGAQSAVGRRSGGPECAGILILPNVSDERRKVPISLDDEVHPNTAKSREHRVPQPLRGICYSTGQSVPEMPDHAI
jgi:hypothetical protein